jgi:hypothetical protein
MMGLKIRGKTENEAEPNNHTVLNQADSHETNNKDSKSLSLNPIELISKWYQQYDIIRS